MKLHLIIILCTTLFAVGCTMLKPSKQGTKEQYKLILELIKNVTPQQLQQKYPELDLSNFKPINKTKNIWSIDTNLANKTVLEQALKTLSADKSVASVRLVGDEPTPPSNSTNTKKGKATVSG